MNTNKGRADVLRSIAHNDYMIDGRVRGSGYAIMKVVEALENDVRIDEANEAKDKALQDIGDSAGASIAEMVAALECDYDRLEELREERETATKTVIECESDLANEIYDDAIAKGVLEVKRDYARMYITDTEEEFLELSESAGDDCTDREDAEQRIHEDALSVEVRSGWASSKDEFEPEEFCILLSTGGPATRIIGELRDGQPYSARLQVQDWFTPWTDYRGDKVSHDDLLAYAACFYFGE